MADYPENHNHLFVEDDKNEGHYKPCRCGLTAEEAVSRLQGDNIIVNQEN